VGPADGDGEIDMKRKWNWPIWVGFLVAVAGVFSYGFFARYPITRDFPWANLLLLGIGTALLIVGLSRAFGRPQLYRGKIFGSIFTAIALFLGALFCYEIFYVLRQVPPSTGAPRVSEKAPAFTLPDQDNNQVSLADLLSAPTSSASTAKANGVLLIFYRGFW
jgi:hypothetical protein